MNSLLFPKIFFLAMNDKINSSFLNDLKTSNFSDKELNDILMEELLTYSEDKSFTINIHQFMINIS